MIQIYSYFPFEAVNRDNGSNYEDEEEEKARAPPRKQERARLLSPARFERSDGLRCHLSVDTVLRKIQDANV